MIDEHIPIAWGFVVTIPHVPQPRAVSELSLAAVPTAVRLSRAFMQLTLREWGLVNLTDDAELVISELVTNAVRITGTTEPAPSWTQLQGVPTIHLRLALFQTRLVIEVHDVDPNAPARQELDTPDDSESGRGLSIVAALCVHWSYYPTQAGKAIWAELAIPQAQPVSGGLPLRTYAYLPVRRVSAVPLGDVGLLARVRNGLQQL